MTQEQLTKIINDWENCIIRQNMINGFNYYLGNNKIIDRKFYLYNVGGNREIDNYRSNVKIPDSFLKIIIDQKTSYCVGKEVTIEGFNTILDVNEELLNVSEEASQKGVAWNYVYIDELENIKLKVMESQNIIPIRDNTIEENLINIIRLFELDGQKMAEVWDDMTVTTYVKNDEGLYVLTDIRTHLANNMSWGVIPFIELKNNRYQTTDLNNIKPLIDAYDIIISDFTNNFVDFQELILFIKNYNENVSTPEAAIEVIEWLKKYKVINVKQDGSIDILSKEVPFQARAEILKILKKLIFTFSQSVDMDDLTGGSITNVVIKSYFANLDLKADRFISEIKKYILNLLRFQNIYNKLKNRGEQALTNVKIIFNKSTIINESEIIESCVKSVDVISKETIIANHPWVTNVQEELDRVQQEELDYKEDVVNDEFTRNEE